MVAGLSGLVTCLQSNFICTNFRGLLFKLRRSRAFPLSLMFPLFPFGRLLIGWLQAAWWGWGILPFQGKPKLRSGPPVSPGSLTFPPVFVSMEGPIMGLLYHLWGQSNIEIWVTLGGRTGSVFFLNHLPRPERLHTQHVFWELGRRSLSSVTSSAVPGRRPA